MADQNPVNWFEIPTSDLERATTFYQQILGLELTPNEMGPMKMAFFPMSPDGMGAGGTLVKSEGYTPSRQGTLVYFHVKDIDATMSKVSESGGRALLPKTSIGEYGFIAHFEDTEGNRVALHQMA